MAAYIAARRKTASIKRTRRNPLDLPDNMIIAEYRLNRFLIQRLCADLQSRLARKTKRSNSLSVEEQVLLCLKLLASGSFQNCAKDYINVSQPTVSLTFSRFLDAMGEMAPSHIKMPKNLAATMQKFHAIAGFPGVIGAVDGTHVPLIAPRDNEHLYVCRKGFHSINIQAVCDADMIFTDVVAQWPGGCHDSFILRQSTLYDRFERLEFGRGILLGDSGYPLKKWLLTPYQDPADIRQEAYNKAHKETRVTVERAFGVLKQRWRVLDHTGGYLCYEPLKVCKIFVCCAMLHNMCRRHNIPLPGELPIVTTNDGEESFIEDTEADHTGKQVRDNIANGFIREG